LETSNDSAARARAVDPRFNVVLEASAGTGKTRVLVDRYINLLKAGVDPSNILAITFTRKAAAEMRERIMATLRAAAAAGEIPPARWREIRDRTADIAISTIDAFCLSLLREFPLEADLDPAFSIADDTELPRLVDEALDRALRTCRSVARHDRNVALAFAQLGERRVRTGLTTLLNRRIVAPDILAQYLAASGAADLDADIATRRAAAALMDVFDSMRGGADRFLESGPLEPAFHLLAHGLRQLRAALAAGGTLDPGTVQAVFSRTREHFLTQEGDPRVRSPYPKTAFAGEADWQIHRNLVVTHADAVLRVAAAYRRDLNVLVSRGIWRMFRVAEAEYRRTLDAHAVLDFSDLLLRALDLLRRMDDFAQSRYRLESRYHHLLVDEFQDTSRAQWELVSLLVQSWGQGAGLAHTGPLPPSIFIVGDRKQSIYAFRDADVSVLREAGRYLEGLRPDRDVRRSISRSFRAVPPILSLINDVCHDIEKAAGRSDAFEYTDTDRFPIDPEACRAEASWRRRAPADGESPLGIVVAETPEACAEATAAEIARLLSSGVTIRDRETGVRRGVRPGDIGILFRTRESHREFEAALERHEIRSHVYKGLGFFDADEIKDVLALVWYLADPVSDLRAAAVMRSRFFDVSDEALRQLAPNISDALRGPAVPPAWSCFDDHDRLALGDARDATRRWLALVDHMPAAELIDVILSESAYGLELRGARFQQARENLKKMRSLIRRIQNRGYGTLARMAAHLDRLAVGDEANAAIDAFDAVNLMTVHAAKGLEFPVVFVVNLARGSGNRRDPVRLTAGAVRESGPPSQHWPVGSQGDPTSAGGTVAVGDFQSEADDDHLSREREETKRLLYVALTRARDRLYLGTVLKDGLMQPGRGSLGEVLPATLRDKFAAATTDATEWRSSSGAVHPFRVCSPFALGPAKAGPHESVDAGAGPDTISDVGTDPDMVSGVGPDPDTVSGVGAGPPTPKDSARRLDDDDFSPLVETTPAPHMVDAADRMDNTLVAEMLERLGYPSEDQWLDVPFTMRVGESVYRGTIDCLIQTAPGTIAVLEFKTGSRCPEHAAQLDFYREAAERLFPGMTIEARLVYPTEPATV
jgi:ATP-dependent helicase/nuclease subunit A